MVVGQFVIYTLSFLLCAVCHIPDPGCQAVCDLCALVRVQYVVYVTLVVGRFVVADFLLLGPASFSTLDYGQFL